MLIYGLFPYLAPLFLNGRLTEAGLVILGFPLGGVVYSVLLPRLMRLLTRPQMMVIGASIVGTQLVMLSFVPPWPVQSLILLVMGLGFFMLHALIQFTVTELSPTAGALAMSLHSASYFFGMATGADRLRLCPDPDRHPADAVGRGAGAVPARIVLREISAVQDGAGAGLTRKVGPVLG